MPAPPSVPQPPEFLSLTRSSFDALVNSWGWPAFRADQVRDWVYRKLAVDPAQMTNLPHALRKHLAGAVRFPAADIVANQLSADGTRKLLLRWDSGTNAETVMIPDAHRRTACVSSQVGCPVGCTFCASGIGGVKGSLSAGQIVEQIYALNRTLRVEASGTAGGLRVQGSGLRTARPRSALNREPRTLNPKLRTLNPNSSDHITNVVFMGMGEPLANYGNVMDAVRILHDPKHFNLGARRITISTVGVPSKMRQLAEEDLPVNLALSLHAPTEPLRRELIPWAEHFALDEILDAARYYFERTGREVTLEYILLSGVNDRPQHARQLVGVCRKLRCNVNLIRYNEVAALPYKRPKAADVVEFQRILRDAGVNAHVRKSRGRDIDAACGQLRRKEQQERDAATVRLGTA